MGSEQMSITQSASISSQIPSLHLLSRQRALPTDAHYGVSADAAVAIGLIALSRLVRTKDEATVARVAASPLGEMALSALRSTTLRVVKEIDPLINDSNISSMFNLPGSAVKYQSQYGTFGSLQARVPWGLFKRLVAALFESLTAARRDQTGYVVGQMLLAGSPGMQLNLPQFQLAIHALIAFVEPAMQARLVGEGNAPAPSSSSESTRRDSPPPQLPPPEQLVQPAAPQPVFVLDPTTALASNLLRAVESRARRALSASEAAAIASALDEGLSVLQSGGGDERSALLNSNILVALTNQSAAWLWASAMEAIGQPANSVAAMASAIIESCSTTAAMLFSDAVAEFTGRAVNNAGRAVSHCTIHQATQ
jgi:hypothetical protein